MKITINGDSFIIDAGTSLLSVLETRCFANRSGTAVAVNNTVVPKEQWSEIKLNENDRILIIAATKGG